MSRKDTYRQKVYDAESRWLRDSVDLSGEVLDYVQAQLLLDTLVGAFDIGKVVIRQNKKLRQYAGWYIRWSRTIEIKRPVVGIKTLLHEFSHHLDAERHDYDGKGHGGSYTQAMLEVVEFYFDRSTMAALLRSYEQEGAIIGADVSRKVADRTSAGIDRRQSRHGTVEEAWAIKLGADGQYWLEQSKDGITSSLSYAGVWKRKSTADRIAAEESWGSPVVVKVLAELDTLSSNRWWAIEELEET